MLMQHYHKKQGKLNLSAMFFALYVKRLTSQRFLS